MKRDEIINEYFRWLSGLVNEKGNHKDISYTKLLTRLHETEFIYSLPMDENRAANGVALRYRFECEHPDVDDIKLYLTGPCSILEMMIALSLKCENIMDNPHIGNRTSQWFWGMVTNLGLGSMYDSHFDIEYVDAVLKRFVERKYEPNGKGGLFTIKHNPCDLRNIEIWRQLMWYLGTIP